MNCAEIKKNSSLRNPSIDITKGILICFLVLHHIEWVEVGTRGVDNVLLSAFRENVFPSLFVCYFMQTFFMITGYCSNFEKDAKSFLTGQIKILLIPNAVFAVLCALYHSDISHLPETLLLYGGGLWFLTAMFLSKICYFYLWRTHKNHVFVISILLFVSFLGTLLNHYQWFENMWWHRHAMDMAVYIAIGHLLKKKNFIESRTALLFVVAYLSILGSCNLINISLPIVTAAFSCNIGTWPLHVLLATCGSIAFIKLCSYWKQNTVLEYLGRNSLIIYMWHLEVLCTFIPIFEDAFMSNSYFISAITTYSLFVTVLSLSVLIGLLMNIRYTKWMLGKF